MTLPVFKFVGDQSFPSLTSTSRGLGARLGTFQVHNVCVCLRFSVRSSVAINKLLVLDAVHKNPVMRDRPFFLTKLSRHSTRCACDL